MREMTPFDARLHRRGVALVGLAALLWSIGGLLVRLIGEGELTVIFWRSAFAAAFLLAYLLLRWGAWPQLWARFRQLGRPGLLVSACLAADTVLFILAYNRTSVANVVLIFSTTPFAAAALAWIVLRERVRPGTWLAMLICFLGVGVMVSGSLGRSSLAGDLLALCTALLFAVPVVTIRRHPDIQMLPAVFLAALMSAGLCLPFAELVGPSPTDFALMGVFGIFEYGLATVAFAAGARYIPAAQSTLLGLLETVLAPLWVWIVVNERPSMNTLVGGTIVLAALLGYCVRDLRASQPASREA